MEDQIAALDSQIAEETTAIETYGRKIERTQELNPENAQEINYTPLREYRSHQLKKQELEKQKAALQLQEVRAESSALKELQKQMEQPSGGPGQPSVPSTPSPGKFVGPMQPTLINTIERGAQGASPVLTPGSSEDTKGQLEPITPPPSFPSDGLNN